MAISFLLYIKHKQHPQENKMANPYHDETGKFCSKGEMQTAINKLASKGDFEGYFALRTELERIEKNQIVISKEAILKLYNRSPLIENVKDKEELSNLYETLKDKLKSQEEPYTSVISFLESNLDENSKAQLIESLPANRKAEILNKIRNDQNNVSPDHRYPYTSDLIKNFTKGEMNDGVVSELSASKFLTFEEKYNIAKAHKNGLAILALEQPKIFFNEPTLRKELMDQASKTDSSKEKEEIAHAMSFSSNPEDIHWAVNNSQNWGWKSAIYNARVNPNMDAATGKVLIHRTLTENVEELLEMANDTSRALKKKNSAFSHIVMSGVQTRVAPYKATAEYEKMQTVAQQKIDELTKIYNSTEDNIQRRTLKREINSQQAVLDAGEKESKELEKALAHHSRDRKYMKNNPSGWREVQQNYVQRINRAELHLRGRKILERLEEV